MKQGENTDTISIYQTKQTCYLAAAGTPPPKENPNKEFDVTVNDTKISLQYSVKNSVEENAYRFLNQQEIVLLEFIDLIRNTIK